MNKVLILPLLLLPLLTWAQCGVERSEGTVNILVGTNATNCFDGAGFRETFLAGVSEGLADERAARERTARSVPGVRRAPKLPESEAGQQGGRYYGQR